MLDVNLRLKDGPVHDWVVKKKNRSQTVRDGLELLYKKELQEEYDKNPPKVTVSDV